MKINHSNMKSSFIEKINPLQFCCQSLELSNPN
jgi:hypothetical protein